MKISQEIQSDFQMIGNFIKKINVSNVFLELPPMDQLNYSLEAEYDNVSIEPQKNGGFIGSIDLWVKVIAKKKGGKEKISLLLILNGGFFDSRVKKEEDFEKFLTINGAASLYSIARGIIIGLSSTSMNGGQIILPMINFFKMKEKKVENKQK